MTKQLNTDQLDRLAEIKEEILDLLSEALDLVRGTPEEQRANHWFATWLARVSIRYDLRILAQGTRTRQSMGRRCHYARMDVAVAPGLPQL
jgi:hypothetical protein